MRQTLKYILFLIIVLIVVVSVGLGFAFPNTSRLVICLVTGTLPDSNHILRIRDDLQGQVSFINMLVKHENKSVSRYQDTGEVAFVKKYLHKTPTSMFDIEAFHDVWEVWVRTDIVNGKPITSYLVRLGLIKDTNAETFFSNQCKSDFCRSLMKALLRAYNKMFDYGIFKPIRLNITDLDETSSVSRKRTSLEEWNEMVHTFHNQEIGISFTEYYRKTKD